MQNHDGLADNEVTQADRKPSKKLWKRILAGVLAISLLLSMFLGYAVQIRFAQLNYLGTVLEHAAAVTADHTGYLSESALKRAWNILRYAVGKPKTYEDYEMYASLAIARTEYAEAIPYMQGCIDRYSGDSSSELAVLKLRLGSLYALSDDAENAIACFDAALETESELADAYLLRAQMYSLLGDSQKAAADVRSYDALAGDDTAVRGAIGSLYESAGDYENAVACYSVALEQAGGRDPEILASRARCYILLRDMDAAKKDLIAFFAEGGKDPTGEYNVMLGLCRMESGEYEMALSAFHNALNAGYVNEAMICTQCVLCAYILGDFDTVITDGERALAAMDQPDSGEITVAGLDQDLMSADELHHWIGLARMGKNDFAGAKENFLMVHDRSTVPEGVDYYLGLCCASLGENEEALDYYSKSIENQEMTSLCYYNRGVSYLQLEKLEEGLTDLLTVLQRNDDADATAAATQLLGELGVNVVFENRK